VNFEVFTPHRATTFLLCVLTVRSASAECFNTYETCRSPRSSGTGYDCWIELGEKCLCAQGAARVTSTIRKQAGVTSYKYECCTTGETDGEDCSQDLQAAAAAATAEALATPSPPSSPQHKGVMEQRHYYIVLAILASAIGPILTALLVPTKRPLLALCLACSPIPVYPIVSVVLINSDPLPWDHFNDSLYDLGRNVWPLLALLPLFGFVSFKCFWKPRLRAVQKRAKELEAPLWAALKDGSLRLLSVEWLRKQPTSWRFVRRQDLPDAAFVSPRDALRLLDLGRVAALSYRWLSREHPDPKASPGTGCAASGVAGAQQPTTARRSSSTSAACRKRTQTVSAPMLRLRCLARASTLSSFSTARHMSP